jgi:S1-C subfamily serine protease
VKKIMALRFLILSIIGLGIVAAVAFNPVITHKNTVVVTGEATFNVTKIEQSTVLVVMPDVGLGSGIAISKHMILTARHCIIKKVYAQLQDGTRLTTQNVILLGDLDAAVIVVKEELTSFVECGKTPAAPSRTWIFARIVGEMEGPSSFGWTQGTVATVKDSDGDMLLNQAGYPGCSGGGVFNDQGKLVGLLIAGVVSRCGLIVTIPMDEIMDCIVNLGLGN